MDQRPKSEKRVPTRTCVGCGLRADAAEMVRLVVADEEVAFDLAGGGFGRGVHLHPTPSCSGQGSAGLATAALRPAIQK